MSILTMKCLDDFAQTTVRTWPARCHQLYKRIQCAAVVHWIRVAEVEQAAQMISVQVLPACVVEADRLAPSTVDRHFQLARTGARNDGSHKFIPIHNVPHIEKEIVA
jgi:hypothetical protein